MTIQEDRMTTKGRGSMKRSNLLASCALAAMLIAPGAALAQGAEAGASSDIIVTAQRRAERLEDVPAAISVLNQELLE